MNSNPDAPKFALIQYCLNKTDDEIVSLNFVIPSGDGKKDESRCLMSFFEKIKHTQLINIGDVNEFVVWMKAQNALNTNNYNSIIDE